MLRHFGGIEQNSLLHLVNEQQTNGDQDVLEFLKMSPYVDESTLKYVIKLKQSDFKIISLNCQSLYAKIDN